MKHTHKLYDKPPEEVLSNDTLRKVNLFIKQGQGYNKMGSSIDMPHCASNGHPNFVVDGFGRWREVPNSHNQLKRTADRGNILSQVLKTQSFDCAPVMPGTTDQIISGQSLAQPNACANRTMHSEYQKLPSIETKSNNNEHEKNVNNDNNPDDHRKNSNSSTRTSYKNLSTALRSNIFPGVGKSKWRSSMKETFIDSNAPPPWFEEQFFGIHKDSFMEWSEYDVFRQRLMKAWEKHQEDIPKVSRKEIPRQQPKAPKRSPPKRKEKKVNPNNKPKLKPKKEDKKPTTEAQPNPQPNPQPTVIQVKPAPDTDQKEDFWDFYDEPFVQ